MSAQETIEVIDMTPTWEAITPIFIAALENGTDKGKTAARGELTRMAKLADRYVKLHAKLPDEVRDVVTSNATFAWDNFQSKYYRDKHGRDTAVSAHAQNVTDTLAEKGITGHDRAALSAYYMLVSELLSK